MAEATAPKKKSGNKFFRFFKEVKSEMKSSVDDILTSLGI